MLRKPGNSRRRMQRFSGQLSFRRRRRQLGRNVLRRPRKIEEKIKLLNQSNFTTVEFESIEK